MVICSFLLFYVFMDVKYKLFFAFNERAAACIYPLGFIYSDLKESFIKVKVDGGEVLNGT